MREILLAFFGLRFLARLLRAGDPQRAGERLDRELDDTAAGLWEWVRMAGGCLLFCFLIAFVVSLVGGLIEVVVACVRGLF